MKKSTLFFKVMVLLALLVPWAAWGQDDVSTRTFPGGGDEWWKDSKTKGTLTLTIDGNGNIVDGEYKSSYYNGIKAEESVSNGVLSFDLQDWKFPKSYYDFPVIHSSFGWDAKRYFSIKLDGENEGGHETVKISKDQNALSDYNNKYFKIKVTKGGREGNIKVVFKKGQTDISNNLTFSYAEKKGSKPYDGKNISVDEAKDGLTILNNASKWNGEYTITVEEGKDVGKYDITVTIKTSEYTANKTFTDAYEITPKELTVTIKGQTKILPGGTIETDASQWAEIKDKETAIISGDEVSLTGKIKEGEEGKLVADGDITTSNTNYTVKTVEPGTLTVKYELTDENWKQILNVTGEGKYPYDGEEHAATVTGKDGIDLSNCIEIVYRKKIEQGGTSIIEGKPVNAGEYEIVIRANEECDNVTITGENKQITVGEITINKREITVTGSLTIKEGEPLKDSYKFSDIEELNATGIIKGEEETVKAAITITPKNKEKPTASEDAFTITLAETVINYTISEESKIALVVEEDPDKWQEGEAVETIVVSVNSSNVITKSDKDDYKVLEGGALQISFDKGTLAGYKISKEENQPVVSGEVSQYFAWEAIGNSYDVLMVRGQDGAYNAIPNSVKIRITNEEKDGYIQINFVKDESTEEPGGDDEDMAWADDENKKASITVYVDKSSGQPLKSEPAMDPTSFAIDLTKFEELEGEWSFATTEETKAIIDKDLRALYSFVVFEGDLLLEPQPEFNSESLSSVKVKIENGDNVGYLEINFKTITVIAEDDINKGGDDDNNNDQIDDDETTFVGDATGGKYVIYDGMSHGLGMLEITVDGETKVLKETDGAYDVVYGESEEEPVDAGTYSATITFNEAMGYSGTVTLTNSVVIAQRPITLYFSFEEGILEGEEFVLGENVFIDVKEGSFAEGEKAEFDELIEKGIISAKFALGETQSDGTVEVKLVSFNYPAGEVSGYDLKYSNYDPKLLTGHVKEHGEGGTETELPDAGEAGEDGIIDYPGEGDSGVIVGDVDIIDEETGIGGSGINYRQYELKFCETDFFPNLNDYEVEGLKLFSRHNKFYTKANGSFTIWYEKDGVKNGEYGDYRIYISRNGADGDYSELKLDEVSDYFQIRNVNSDIWVRIYYGTGFPVANEEITATDARAYAQANKIVVITPEPTDVQIISMAGAVVATDQVTGQREFANLAEGVYIVRMGETVIKLQVRN